MSVTLTDEYFEKFRQLILNESGIHFTASNRAILESRLRERLRSVESDDLAQYFALIRKDEGELKTLLDSVTTNLTRFFRNEAHFKAFQHYVVPDVVEHKRKNGERTVTVWSAGCSTGEEPYSVAIMLKELLPAGMGGEVVASDLSLKSLMTAKEGFYPESKVGNVPPKYLQRYFTGKDGGYLVNEDVRSMVRFDYHNLKFDAGHRELDVVFCRNVIIYFDEAAQKAVIGKFFEAMGNHSYLFIGHSESLFGMDTQFEFVKTDWATLYRKFV